MKKRLAQIELMGGVVASRRDISATWQRVYRIGEGDQC